MGTLLDAVDSTKLENQREVVKNERRQGVDNQPYGTAFENMTERAFPEGHPYHHSVIGSMEDLSAATLADVQQFFRTYYAPNNAVLVIAGDIDVARTREMVRRHFGWIPRGPAKPPLRDASLPALIGSEQRLVVRDSLAPAPAVFVGYRMPAARDARGPAAELLAHVLASGRSARLYESLVREQQIATSVFGFVIGLVDGADVMMFGAYGKPTTNADSLEQALLRELDRSTEGFAGEELARAKVRERFGDINALQVLGGFGGRADRLAEAETFYGNPNKVNTRLAELDAVTVGQLDALARERLVPINRVRLVYIPAKVGVTP
jgi:predicted Zn-dependent peptidase